jgi:hypothetical protein
MKQPISLLFLCLFSTAAFAQPSIEWEKSFGGTSNEYAFTILNTTDGGYLIGCETQSNNGDVTGNHGSSDIWLTKINSNGVKLWQKCLGGLDYEAVTGMDNTSDGGYILVGMTESNGAKTSSQVFGNRGGRDIWVAKLDANGAIQWRQCYGGCDRDDSRAIRQTADGNYVIAGATMSVNSGEVWGAHGDFDGWVLKIDAVGAMIWQKTIGGSQSDYLYGIEEASNGDLIIAGVSTSTDGDMAGNNNHGIQDVWVAKLSPNGDLGWNKVYGGSDADGGRALCIAANGNIIVAGLTGSYDGDVSNKHGGNDAWILGLDGSGDLLWERAFGGSGEDYAYNVFQRADNDFIFAGEVGSFDGDAVGYHGGRDAWVVKFDKEGTLKSQICLGGSAADYARTAGGGMGNSVLVGATTSSADGDVSLNHGLNDTWIVKLSVPLGLKPDVPNGQVIELKIIPNPASELVQIVTNVSGEKKIEIFNIDGKLIHTLQTDQQEPSIQIQNLPAGSYQVRILTKTGQLLNASFIKL